MKRISLTQKSTLIPFLGFAVPAFLIAGSYIDLAAAHHTWWLLNAIVHENGRYTLLQTIFYFRHFTWEIPGKALYSVFLVGVYFYYGNAVERNDRNPGPEISSRKILLAGAVCLAIVGAAILMTAGQVGWREALFGFLQYRRNESSPLEFGSHWRNHFLSNVTLFASSGFCVLLYRIFGQGGVWTTRKHRVLRLSLLVFLAATLMFGFSRDQFAAPSYLGHQLREILGTDLPITMLLAISLLICLERKYDANKRPEAGMRKSARKGLFLAICWLVPAILSTGYLGIRILNLDVAAELAKVSGTTDKSVLGTFCWHFYEHSLDYLFVTVTVYWLYLWLRKTESEGSPRET